MKKLLYLLILPLILFLVSCGGGEDDLEPITQSLEETLVGNKWCLSNNTQDGFLLSPGGSFFTTQKCNSHDWQGSWIIENNLIKYSFTQNSIQTTVLFGEVTEFSSNEVKLLIYSDQNSTAVSVYSLTPEDIYGCTDIDGSNYNPSANCDDGSCLVARTYVPDDNFEEELIYLGYDDILDDSVKTSYIDTIKSLNLNYSSGSGINGIRDLTGIEAFISLNRLRLYAQWRITQIDLSNLYYLQNLDLGGTEIIELDLSNNPNLSVLKMFGMNELSSLDLRNGNNTNLSSFSLIGLDALDCISVDDTGWSYANWEDHWRIYYSEDCP